MCINSVLINQELVVPSQNQVFGGTKMLAKWHLEITDKAAMRKRAGKKQKLKPSLFLAVFGSATEKMMVHCLFKEEEQGDDWTVQIAEFTPIWFTKSMESPPTSGPNISCCFLFPHGYFGFWVTLSFSYRGIIHSFALPYMIYLQTKEETYSEVWYEKLFLLSVMSLIAIIKIILKAITLCDLESITFYHEYVNKYSQLEYCYWRFLGLYSALIFSWISILTQSRHLGHFHTNDNCLSITEVIQKIN